MLVHNAPPATWQNISGQNLFVAIASDDESDQHRGHRKTGEGTIWIFGLGSIDGASIVDLSARISSPRCLRLVPCSLHRRAVSMGNRPKIRQEDVKLA